MKFEPTEVLVRLSQKRIKELGRSERFLNVRQKGLRFTLPEYPDYELVLCKRTIVTEPGKIISDDRWIVVAQRTGGRISKNSHKNQDKAIVDARDNLARDPTIRTDPVLLIRNLTKLHNGITLEIDQ